MQQGYYRVEYGYMSRGGSNTRGPSKPGHLAAAANYYANSNKCPKILHVNMSADRHEIGRILRLHDATITRKNGRLAETPQLCFDKRMSIADMEAATKRILWRVTFQGQIKAAAFIHLNDPNNPHCHLMVIDVGRDGQPVGHFGRSGSYRREHSPVKGNPVEWFRRVWEEECNGVLQEHGYDFRIDRRTNIERGLQEAQKHRGYDNDNRQPLPEMDEVNSGSSDLEEPDAIVWDQPGDGAEVVPSDALSSECEPGVEEPIPDEDETLAEDADDGEGPMPLPVSKRLENARRDLHELKILNHKRNEAVKLRNEWEYWRSEADTARQKAEQASNAHADAIARTETAKLEYQRTHLWGFRRGIDIKLGPIHIRTAGAEKAIRAEAEQTKAEYAEALRAASFRDANHHANYVGQKIFELEQKVAGIEHSIDLHERINGQLQDFDNAEIFLEEMVKDDLEGVTPAQVLDAYENEELSAADAKELLVHMGHSELIELLEAPTPSVRH